MIPVLGHTLAFTAALAGPLGCVGTGHELVVGKPPPGASVPDTPVFWTNDPDVNPEAPPGCCVIKPAPGANGALPRVVGAPDGCTPTAATG